MEHSYKVILARAGGVGKTTYVNRLVNGEFERKYLPTVAPTVNSFGVTTTIGKLSLEIWDTVGQEEFGHLRSGYYADAKAMILMADCQAGLSSSQIKNWYKDIHAVTGDIPVVVAFNKADLPQLDSDKQQCILAKAWCKKNAIPYYDMSVKSCYCYDKPVMTLLHTLVPEEWEIVEG
jgi:GTP-binding nuclear protein Ran